MRAAGTARCARVGGERHNGRVTPHDTVRTATGTSPGAPASPSDGLDAFHPATRAWFSGAFAAPTPAQSGAWSAIRSGSHALVVAPTGSGKTLAAFLWSLDRLLTQHLGDDARTSGSESEARPLPTERVLYVSPLKALAADVERNLSSPLRGIRHAAASLGLDLPELRVGVRTGDTPPAERRALATRPPDILITTPESLFLMLTSSAREGLRDIGTVIVDEIHAVAATKRGAHLAVSLERLDALLETPARRVGLSATARPVEVVAEMLAGHRTPAEGGREVVVVQPPSAKQVDLDVVLAVPDLTNMPAPPGVEDDLSGPAAGPLARASIWPHVEERIVDLASQSRSTIVFTNSRRTAERLTARLNEIWAQRQGEDVIDHGSAQPAAVPGQSGTGAGAPGEFARAHHGSMSRAERTHTESELKAGRLPVVVATSSLELGIDMGAVDLVIQVGSPPSVSSGLQRVGRAGHQVGTPSHGVVLPTHRGDLLPAAVTAMRMRDGEIERLAIVRNPLDVLAQHVVAMVALEEWSVTELAALVRRSAPFARLPDSALHSVLDMLAGKYPSEQFGELRARVTWDRARDVLTGRPGAQRLAVTSGGTIPDRGMYGVFLVAPGSGQASDGGDGTDDAVRSDATPGRARGGRRVGELDEEMVYESRVSDTFTLGSSTWRIEDITPDRVLVSPAPGLPGRLPFWKGDSPGRPAELGRALGAWLRTLDEPGDAGTTALRAHGLDDWAAENLLAYVAEQRAATGILPDDRTILVERFRDELGDWRLVVHSPYGARVHGAWALVVAARLRDRFGMDVAAMHADDGIVLRLPDVGPSSAGGLGALAPGRDATGPRWTDAADAPDVADDLMLDPDETLRLVRENLGGSVMFAARFREAAARALLLPRRSPDRRQPLWQQRLRSAQLLEVAAEHDQFPIVHEAARECLQEDFDIDALVDLMARVRSGEVRVVHVDTPSPSPFAQSLLFSYTAQFLYDGDAPLAERRAAALTLDPTLLDEILGRAGEAEVADLLDVGAVQRTAAELDGTAPERHARHADDVLDLLRRLGPLTDDELAARVREDERASLGTWLDRLTDSRQVVAVRLPGRPDGTVWAAIEDTPRLRDGLGAAIPPGVPDELAAPVPDPLGDLVLRHARTHVPFPASEVAHRFGLPLAVVSEVLARLQAQGHLVSGRLLPEALGGTGAEHCHRDVMRLLRRRSLAALRAEVEPVDPRTLGVFLPRWHRLGELRGRDGLLRAVEQLAGLPLPASDLETHVLPARVVDYDPAMLDDLTTSGLVLWAGHAALPGAGRSAGNGLVSLHLADTAHLTLPRPGPAAPADAAPRPVGDDGRPDVDRAATGAPSAPSGARSDVSAGDRVVAPAGSGGAPAAVPGQGATPTPDDRALVLAALDGDGAYFLDRLVARVAALLPADPDGAPAETGPGLTDRVRTALWDLVWEGRVTNDSLGPVRELLGIAPRRSAPRRRPPRPGRTGRYGLASLAAAGRPGSAELRLPGSLRGGGRWSLLPPAEADDTRRAHALAAVMLDRHGVVTRAVGASEQVGPSMSAVVKVLAALEQTGDVRRGYFVEHLGGSQFAVPGAVDTLRGDARDMERASADRAPAVLASGPAAATGAAGCYVLAACDPANPYGAALAWPGPQRGAAQRPGRKAGAVVVLVDGTLGLYIEKGGRTMLTFTDDAEVLAAGARTLADAVVAGRLGRLTLRRLDGEEVFGLDHPAIGALTTAGFTLTPRGLTLRGGAARA